MRALVPFLFLSFSPSLFSFPLPPLPNHPPHSSFSSKNKKTNKQKALFAKLAFTELRARKGVCSGNCTTYHCFKGGPAEPPEGMETEGCPLGSHPANLSDNAACVRDV